jgi:sulfate-transporting ATPase
MTRTAGELPGIGEHIVPTLTVDGLVAGYSGQAAVRGVSLTVGRGEIVALLGPNGAGKTTTVLAIAGAIPMMAGEIRKGTKPLTGPLHSRSQGGLTLITQERSVIMGLSVTDNIRLGGVDEDEVYGIFPELADHRHRMAALLSGGQQQMLTVGRALCRRPELMLVDELSFGLAPVIVDRLLGALRDAAREGVSMLIVEQHVEKALSVADRAYVLSQGIIRHEASAESMLGDAEIIKGIYLGESA